MMCGWPVIETQIDDMVLMMMLAPVLIKINVCGKNTFCKMVYEKVRGHI
jgi:hypothetical protein